MLVVVIPVGRVPVAVMDVVDVVTVRDRLMAAAWAVLVLVSGMRQVRQRVLIVVVPVLRVRVPLMNVVDVPFALHARVPAGWTVPVCVVGVIWMGVVTGGCHCSSLLC